MQKTNFKFFLESSDLRSAVGKTVFLLTKRGFLDVDRPSLVTGKRVGQNHSFSIDGDIILAKIVKIDGNEVKLQFPEPVDVKWEYDGYDTCKSCFIDLLDLDKDLTVLTHDDPKASEKILMNLLKDYKSGHVSKEHLSTVIKLAREYGFDHVDFKAIEKSMGTDED